jgi:MFS superfamily sulfate permease-like transporter
VSHISVSGPAAGLTAIILTAINDLCFDILTAAFYPGTLFNLFLGFIKAGSIISIISNKCN